MGGRGQTASFTPPNEFDEYRLVGPLGKGGMGQVYLARDLFLDRMVAVKFLLDVHGGAAALDRFRIEARAIARLQHPNVVVVHRIGEAAGYPYIVSEHIRGKSLAELAKPVPWRTALEIGLGLARGLAAAHVRGVLHRDIKAANAMIDDDGGIKLLDFGLAKLSGEQVVRPPAAIITPVAFDDTGREIATLAAPPALRHVAADDAQGAAYTRAAPAALRHVAGRIDAAVDAHTLAAPPELRHVADADATAPSPSPIDQTTPDAARSPSLDDGVASITDAGALLGTPMYMSPEAWRADPLTAASDVYSLGVVLFELCAGRAPHRGIGFAQLAAVVNAKDAPRLRELAPDVDADFAAVVDRCLVRDPTGRYPTASELRDALEELAATGRAEAIPEGNPYRGLYAFEAEHRALFFGRDHAIREVLERLRGEPFVIVAGDSGAGKSSLCRAGVIPAVLDGALGDGRRWRVARMLPSAHPLQALVAAVALAVRLDEAELLAATRQDSAALGRALRRAAGDDDGVLVLVDQLEELVTVADPGEAETVVNAIRQLAIASPSIRVLATVRGDFLTRVAAQFVRPEEIVRGVHLLLPPGRDDLHSAVVGPARLKGVTFESEALVDELVDAGARAEGGLPLLQFALAQLWNARDASDKMIRASTLAAIGGVGGALARHADEVLARLLPAQREAARRVLLRLVTVEGTRARRAESELVDGDGAKTALDALVRGRLLVAREGDDGTVYEVAHEALIQNWTALREWHEQSRDARVVLDRVERAAIEWDRLGRPSEALWSDRQLAEIAKLDGQLTGRDAEFVAISRQTLRRRRWIRGGSIAAAFGILTIAVVVLFYLRAEADRERIHAEKLRAEARQQYLDQLVDQGRQALLGGDSLRAAEHLAKAHAEGVGGKALGLMLARAVQPLRAQLASRAVGGPVRWFGLDPKGAHIAVVRAGDPVVSVFDLALATERRFETGSPSSNAPFDPVSGDWLATGGTQPAVLRVDGTRRVVLEHDGDAIASVEWSADGVLVAGRSGKALYVWDARSGKQRHRWDIPILTQLAFEGSRQLAASDYAGTIHVWDLASGEERHTLRGHRNYLHRLVFAGSRLASASEDGTARLWDLRAPDKPVVLQHKAAVRSVVFGAGDTVLTASIDRTAKQWSLTGTLLRSLEEHRTPLVRAIFDRSGTRVATAGNDGRVCLHELASEAVQQCLVGHRAAVTAIQFEPSGKLLSGSIDGSVRVWRDDAREFTSSHGFGANAGGFAITRDGRSVLAIDALGTLASIALDRGAARWSVAAHDPGPVALELSADNQRAMTVHAAAIKLWRVPSGALDATLVPPAGTTYEAALLAGEHYVVATSFGAIELYPRATGGAARLIGTHRGVTRLALSPDGTLLASGSSDYTIQLFDTATWQHRATLRGHTGDIWEIVMSPDSQRIASSSRDGSVRLWDRSGRELRVLLAKNAGLLLSPRFDRRGHRLFTAHEDGKIRVWDTSSGELVATLKGHDSNVATLAISPAGDLLASGGWDGGVMLWDLEQLSSLTRWRHAGRVNMVGFTPDGRSVVSASADRTLKIWPVDDGGADLADELALVRREAEQNPR